VLGSLVTALGLADVRDHAFDVDDLTLARDDVGGERLAPLRVGEADDRDRLDCRSRAIMSSTSRG
jgi:hypothetical protein